MFSLLKLIALASAVAAVDIGLWTAATCTGSQQVCTNIPARSCCTPPTTYVSRSASFINKPAAATTVLYFRNSTSACATVFATSTNTATNLCLNPPQGDTRGFAGAAFFPSAALQKRASETSCDSSVTPDTLVLADGTRVNIKNMAADQVEAIQRLTAGSLEGASLPQIYGNLAS